MYRKKYLQKILISSLAVGALSFSPAICNYDKLEKLPIISIAHAEIKTYIGIGNASINFGENDPEIVKKMQIHAQHQAEQNAKEKAGKFIKTQTTTINSIVTEDTVYTVTNEIVNIVDVKFKKSPIEMNNDIGFKLEATVTVTIDTDSILNYFKRSSKERVNMETQSKEVQKAIVKNNKEFEDVQKNSFKAKTQEEKNKVKADLDKAYNELLAIQKLEAGHKFYYQKKYATAVKFYREAIELNPELTSAYSNCGSSYVNLENNQLGIDYLTKAIALNPNNAEAHNKRGDAYWNLKKYDLAKLDYDAAIKIAPNESNIYYINRGCVYGMEEEYYKAIEDFSQAIKMDPKFSFTYYARSVSYEAIEEMDLAAKDYRIYMSYHPGHDSITIFNPKDVYKSLKREMAENELISKTIEYYDENVKNNPQSDDEYVRRGQSYVEMKKSQRGISGSGTADIKDYYAMAIEDFSKAISINANNRTAYLERSKVYFSIGKYDKAIEDCTSLINLSGEKNLDELYENRAYIYYTKKDFNSAVEDFSRAISYTSSTKVNKISELYAERGWCYHCMSNYTKAIEDYTKALSIDRENYFALSKRYYAYSTIGEKDKAAVDYENNRTHYGKGKNYGLYDMGIGNSTYGRNW